MPWAIFDIQFMLPAFAIVLFRVGGLTLTAPLISSSAHPPQLKVAFSFIVSCMIFPVVLRTAPTFLTIGSVIVVVFGELLIGLIIGTTVSVMFSGAELAGTMIGQQAGLALGQVVNPMLDEESSIIGQVYFLVMLMVFLAIGGHRSTVAALLDTYQTIPPGSFRLSESMVTLLEDVLRSAFIFGMRLSAPALTALFIASLVMAFMSRTMPQLNILTVGFAIRAFVALAAAALSMSLSYDLIHDEIVNVFEALRSAFGLGG
ncbi:MAG: flagellar biosynthetic protein FliR [Phycisphaerales bacterium]|nr:flagellar biosynthetic protein FliR [Phycisphaerales bacterium]